MHMRKTAILIIFVLFIVNPVLTSAFTPTYQFTDQPKDFETGLYNYGAREYNPSIGRFIQEDPLIKDPKVLPDGSINPNFLMTASQEEMNDFLANPQNLNPYAYTGNNPVNYVDPKGNIAIPAIALVILGGLFIHNINVAQSPSQNSTPSIIQSKDFGDIVPGYNNIPKTAREGIFLLGGLASFESKLTGKIENKIESKIANKTEQEFVTLVHGSANDFTEIMEKGFRNNGKPMWFTDNIALAETYMYKFGGLGDIGKIAIQIPRGMFNGLIKSGELITKLVEKPDMFQGLIEYGFPQSFRKTINKLIVK
jgi:RHS repeat-associated protein